MQIQELLNTIAALDRRMKLLELNFYTTLANSIDSDLYGIRIDVIHNDAPALGTFSATVSFKGYESDTLKTFRSHNLDEAWSKAMNLVKKLDSAAKTLSKTAEVELVYRPQLNKAFIRLGIGYLRYFLTENTSFEDFKHEKLTQAQAKSIKAYLEATKKAMEQD